MAYDVFGYVGLVRGFNSVVPMGLEISNADFRVSNLKALTVDNAR
ncbi:hypothetical protein Cflav_PD5139 [Pedosphaera parvula Ellin514]|uniref:Uncharacterized protein n=1 Tax=Pedosphaera parvula (strain Ellin514) TaxID=320771 RepID=B9XC36_PEDPL|nr:hypothetical protein Cflav_PD5139 [Pedosphaera parvula Ellin514]